MACEVAASAQVGQLVLFHHDPSYPDRVISQLETQARKKFAKVQAAYEGLEIVIHPENKISSRLQQEQAKPRDVQYADHD